MKAIFPKVFALDEEQKLELIDALWESAVESLRKSPISNGVRTELQQRLANHRLHPEQAVTWDEVEQELARRHTERTATVV